MIKRAGDARDDTVVGREKEQVELAYISAAVKKLADEEYNIKNVDKDDLQDELDISVGTNKTKVTQNANSTLNVLFKDTEHNYNVNNGDVTRVVTGGTAVAAVTNPYSDESWAMAWTYSIDDGWSDTITDNEATLSGEVVAKAYKKDEEYHLVIEPIGESGGMGPLYTYATRKNLIASLPVYVVDSYIVGVKAPTPINQGWMNDYSVYSNITNVVICDGVTDIGDDAFRDCSNLTDVSIGNSVTTIGCSSFRGCSSLTSVDLPDSVTTIGGCAFYDCSSLTNVDLPDSVTTIDEGALRILQQLDECNNGKLCYIDRAFCFL